MKTFVVIDTNIVSYQIKNHTFYEFYRDYLTDKIPLISFMTYYELRLGMIWNGWSSRRIEAAEKIISRYSVIDSDRRLCDICTEVMFARRKQPIDIQDAWIAATAIHQGCPLVTHNASDFVDIPGLDLYTKYQSVKR